MGRYLRLMGALARYGLARELAFRGNLVAKVAVEFIWLSVLLIFYLTVFQKTPSVAEWSEDHYLFFVGCYFAMGALVETFFLSNCNEFADLVRSGDLDFLLLKPIDEQFLVTCRSIDWTTVPNVVVGGVVMGVSLWRMHWDFDPLRVALFVAMFLCGLGLAYGFLVLLTAASVWMVRNQSLYELWWLFSSLMRYPREIFLRNAWASPLGFFFSFVVPAMLVISVPADVMVRTLDLRFVGYTAVATVVLLVVSRRVFRLALRRYRSASS
ncbi:MAG TPA: ABC-2 family transporter protein [Gemmataceae bacterium]|nr:ABC-2 family transporter protein [Gemmataceae bacterium]